jgi:adenylate kinase
VTTEAATEPVAPTGEDRRIIIMIGAPGAGKGTQAERLAAELDLPHISTGELFREALASNDPLGDKVRSYVEDGALVPDGVVVEVVEHRLDDHDADHGVILDGFPRTCAQASALDGMLQHFASAEIAALYVEVNPDLLLARLTGRRICTKDDQHVYHVVNMPPAVEGICDIDGADLYQRADDSAGTVQSRLDKQLPPMYEVIDHYADNNVLFSVRGDKPAEQVTGDLLRVLGVSKAS